MNLLILDSFRKASGMPDVGLQTIEAPLGAGITALAQLADGLREAEIRELLALMMDVIALLAALTKT